MNTFELKPIALILLTIWSAPSFAQTPTHTLPSVVITAERESDIVRSTQSGTRTNTPIQQIPQSIVALPKSLIEDQAAVTVDDVLRNVSNVNSVDRRDSNNTPFKIRGFTSTVVVDGVPMPGYFANQESLVNIEKIEVIKGPAGGLFGSPQGMGSYGNLGGTIAITTAAPQGEPLRSISGSIGSHNHRGVAFDVNQPMSDSLSVRLSGERSKAESESTNVFYDRTSIFPSLAWQPNRGTKVVLRARHLENSTVDYSGLPVNGTLNTSTYSLSRATNIVANNQPDTVNRSNGLNLQWTQHLSDRWQFNLTAAYTESTVDQRGAWLVDATNPAGCFAFGSATPDTNILCGARLWDQFKSTVISPSVTGQFDLGSTRHTLSVGMDYERTRDDAFMTYSNLFGPIAMDIVSLRNPTFPMWSEPFDPSPPDQQNRYNAQVYYVQDQIDIGPMHLLGSLRHSKIDVRDSNPTWGVSNQSDVSKSTPRFGAVWDLSPAASLFAGYSEAIKVPTGAIFVSPPKPEEAQQKEFGIKLNNFFGVSATAAVFELERKNALVANTAMPGTSIQTGVQRARGIDIDARAALSSEITLIGAYTKQTAKIVEDTNATLVGKQLFNVPEQTLRIAGRYDVRHGGLAGMGFGLGLTHHSKLPLDSANSQFTPAGTVWDAQISYRVKDARLGLAISNLFDKHYYKPSAYFSGGQTTPNSPRTLMATATLSF